MTDSPKYRIRDWVIRYEISQSLRNRRPLRWVAIPTDYRTASHTRILRMVDGAAIYGVWFLLLQIAAQCPQRGVLADADGPLTPEDIALMTGCSEESVRTSIEVLSSSRIRWLEIVDTDAESEQSPRSLGDDSERAPRGLRAVAESAPLTGHYKTGHDRT